MNFVITRIIGNELPPRDAVGTKLMVLDLILQNEKANCRKIWVLNQIHDKKFRSDVVHLLKKHHQEYNELRFDKFSYLQQRTRLTKIRAAININVARNYCIDLGKSHDFNFVLDGDCYFAEDMWETTIKELNEDQKENLGRKYYGVPIVRAFDGNENYAELKKWEPNLAFRRDADLRFDESIPFSKNDKVEFLQRLGYQRNLGETAISGELCRNVGCLVHASYGDGDIESDLGLRIRTRNDSLDLLLDRIDKSLLLKWL